MNCKIDNIKYRLHFNFEARTSRQVMTYKDTFFVRIQDLDNPENFGIGEVNLFKGLSEDDTPDFEKKLAIACRCDTLSEDYRNLNSSAINLGFEMAQKMLLSKMAAIGSDIIVSSDSFSMGEKPIIINGLVWMGDKKTMALRIGEKLEQGFKCIKLKIGGIDFDQEISLLENIRSCYSQKDVELRLDANGAFSPMDALKKLDRLSKYDIHSIEQPIKQHQWKSMAHICKKSPIPIALDEELIGLHSLQEKNDLLDEIRPQYIILKPSLCGGFQESEAWIDAASKRNIGWWVTSALESNVGLAAIAQWVAQLNSNMPQGLGTGQLYANNIPSPLYIQGEGLWWDQNKTFDYGIIGFSDRME